MYTKSSEFYDLLYKFKNYKREAETLRELINAECPDAATILDVACGTHEHVHVLKQTFSVDGIDLNTNFLTVARTKNPLGQYIQADMRNFYLDKSYDVVLCLSSSIGYLGSTDELEITLEQFVAHLNPGGLVLIEPWYSPETWRSGRIAMTVGESKDVKVARASTRTNQAEHSLLTFHYMVARLNGVETFKEEHHLILFSKEQIIKAFNRVGLQVRHDEAWSCGRGLYIGSLPPEEP